MTSETKSPYSNLAIISDLTGTLVRQRADGFPESRRNIIRQLIDAAAFFCIITNDSLEAAEEFFISPLGPVSKPYFVVSGGGYVGHQIDGGKFQKLFEGRSIEVNSRQILGEHVSRILGSVVGKTPVLPVAKDQASERTSIADLNKSFGELSFFESTPSKVAVFFLDKPVVSQLQEQIFDAIENDAPIRDIVANKKLYVTRGANYLDITSCVKSEGFSALSSNVASKSYELSNRRFIVLGDSWNDRDLLLYNYQSNQAVTRVFVGENTKLAAEIEQKFPTQLQFIKAGYVEAAEQFLAQLVTAKFC